MGINSRIVGLEVYLCAQVHLILCNLMDYSPPGFSVHGIFQARTLEWVAVSFSRGFVLTQESNQHLLQLLHWQADSLPLSHLGSPMGVLLTKNAVMEVYHRQGSGVQVAISIHLFLVPPEPAIWKG